MSRNPLVSVVVPMYQEADFIEECLRGFATQTYPLDHLEVLVVDGGSTDGSREIVADWASRHSWVHLIDNPDRVIPAACNAGLRHARGCVVCFFSSHGVPSPTYVERSVALLHETGAAGVGGTYVHEGLDPVSRAIGLAMASPAGMGSPHRFAAARRDVDTISHPAYRIDAVQAVGGFDERMERNEDYELNWRIRRAGGRLVFDPTITSTYRPRGSLTSLARQFWWYGRWKAAMVARHPRSLRPRQLVPPAAVATAAVAPLLVASGGRARDLVLAGAAGYAVVVGAATVAAHPRRHRASVRALILAFPIMHGAWGGGFLASLLGGARSGNSNRQSA